MNNKVFTSIAMALMMGQAGMAQPTETRETTPYKIVRTEVTPTRSVWELQRIPDSDRWFVDSNEVSTYEQGRDRLQRAPGTESEGLGREQQSPAGYVREPDIDG